MIRIHDLTTGFEGLSVPGIPFYADRALMLRGTALVRSGPIDDYLAYLRDVDIGPSEVIRLDSDRLVADLATNEGVRAAVLDRVRQGRKLQFFSVTSREEALLDSLGLDWSCVYGAPPRIGAEANDKAELRRLGERLGLTHSFPRHRICGARDTGAVYGAVGTMLAGDECDFVVLKRPDLASGDGMRLVERRRDWLETVHPYLAQHVAAREIIVEAGFRHVPMSAQWEIGADGPSFACATAQLIDSAFVHLGNVLSSGELPSVSADDVDAMRRMSEPFVRDYWSRGFRGICGFDFLRAERDGRLYMLECNGRVTATTYANGIAREVAHRRDGWAIVMTNVSAASSVRTFDDVRRFLGPALFDGRQGALPFNLRCLALPEPKIALACVGRDVDDATRILRGATRLLAA